MLLLGLASCGGDSVVTVDPPPTVGTSCRAAPTPIVTDITSGTTGTLVLGQDFGGLTRRVDVTVLGSNDLSFTTLSVWGINIGISGLTSITAMIYDGGGFLEDSQTLTMGNGDDQGVIFGIVATLMAGTTYSLYVQLDAGTGNTGNFCDPDPPTAGGFPYVESNGVLEVEGAYVGPSPGALTPDDLVPQIDLE